MPQRITVRMSDKLKALLDRESRKKEQTVVEVIRSILEEALTTSKTA